MRKTPEKTGGNLGHSLILPIFGLFVAIFAVSCPNPANPASTPAATATATPTPTSPAATPSPVLPGTGAGTVSTLAGRPFFSDGTGSMACFNNPDSVAVDSSGNVFVTDNINCLIRKMSPAGVVTTFAGSGIAGFADGTGTAASFNRPEGIAIDGDDNIYVSDPANYRIRKISPDGVVTTFAGSNPGSIDGTGTSAGFSYLLGALTFDPSDGSLYALDGQRVRRISTPGAVVQTLAGSGSVGDVLGTGTAASFNNPDGIVADGNGNLYVSDSSNQKIKKIVISTKNVSLLAGTGVPGHDDGASGTATFQLPKGLAFGSDGALYVSEWAYPEIRKIDLGTNTVSTWAGDPNHGGLVDGSGASARFNAPKGLAMDRRDPAANVLYVADFGNSAVRAISASGNVTTPAGSRHDADGKGEAALFGQLGQMARDASGTLWAVDSANGEIRRVDPDGTVSTVHFNGTTLYNLRAVAIDGAGNKYFAQVESIYLVPAGSDTISLLAGSDAQQYGWIDATGPDARFAEISALAVDGAGNLFVADCGNYRIRKVTPAGVVTTVAGSTSGYAEGTGAAAQFREIFGIAVDSQGNIFVADSHNSRIRKVTQAGVVTTFAGNGSYGYVDGSGAIAEFDRVSGLCIDYQDNIYAADTNNHRIRKISPSGEVGSFAGTGQPGLVNAVRASSAFNQPYSIALDREGNLFVAEYGNNVIRKIAP